MSASTAGHRVQLLGDAALTAGMADSTLQNADMKKSKLRSDEAIFL